MDQRGIRAMSSMLHDLPPGERFSWSFRRAALRDEILKNDVSDFMNWPTVREFLYTGDTRETRWYHQHNQWVLAPSWRESLRQPDTGHPDAFGTWDKQVYLWWRFMNYTSMADPGPIFEFGGGYGALCLVARQMGYSGDYYILDLPEVSLLQRYYLSENGAMTNTHLMSSPKAVRAVKTFISVCALSEVPVALRESTVLKYQADNYMLVMQDQHAGVDNNSWMIDTMGDAEWSIDYLTHTDQRLYLHKGERGTGGERAQGLRPLREGML